MICVDMSTVIFLAQCMDKNHTEDAMTIKRLLRIKGIEDAFETHVPYQDEEYCLASISFADPSDHERIILEMQQDKNVKAIKKLTDKQVPF